MDVHGIVMSYNITGCDVQVLKVVIPATKIKAFERALKAVMSGRKVESYGSAWHFNRGGEGIVLSGFTDLDGNLILKQFRCRGDFSDSYWSTFEAFIKKLAKDQPALHFKAEFVWEGRDVDNVEIKGKGDAAVICGVCQGAIDDDKMLKDADGKTFHIACDPSNSSDFLKFMNLDQLEKLLAMLQVTTKDVDLKENDKRIAEVKAEIARKKK